MRRRLAVVLAVLAGAVRPVRGARPAASAHPLGNFTRNTYVGFTVSPGAITVDHVVDLAEVPTFQERHAMDADGDGEVSAAESDAWGRGRCAQDAGQIVVTTDRGPVTWVVDRSAVTFPAGQGGLPTTRLECGLSVSVTGVRSLEAAVTVEQGRVGWHEVTAVGDGVVLTSDVPAATTSGRLSAYPAGATPPSTDSARLSWVPGTTSARGAPAVGGGGRGADSAAVTAVTSIAPRGLDGATRAFTDLVGRHDITLGFGALALAIALLLGGLHALAPGHGKTLMAASLVGTGGRRRDALVLGASVTAAHTAGVVALALALSLSSTIAPESAYPWLGLASAVLAVGVGLSLLRQTRPGRGHTHGPGHGHSHGHSHPHPHVHDDHAHDHPHPHGHAAHRARSGGGRCPAHPRGSGARGAHGRPYGLDPAGRDAWPPDGWSPSGLAGGLVPSPSAVVVLLAGLALGRSWFALLLVVAYGLGMAMTLCLTGVVLVRAGGLSRRVAEGGAVPRPFAAVLTRLPLIAASTVIATGPVARRQEHPRDVTPPSGWDHGGMEIPDRCPGPPGAAAARADPGRRHRRRPDHRRARTGRAASPTPTTPRAAAPWTSSRTSSATRSCRATPTPTPSPAAPACRRPGCARTPVASSTTRSTRATTRSSSSPGRARPARSTSSSASSTCGCRPTSTTGTA